MAEEVTLPNIDLAENIVVSCGSAAFLLLLWMVKPPKTIGRELLLWFTTGGRSTSFFAQPPALAFSLSMSSYGRAAEPRLRKVDASEYK
jgi:hypothetical protein